MKNLFLLIAFLYVLPLSAQDTYFLNKRVGVKCAGGNPLIDHTKKLTVEHKEDETVFTIKCLSCQNQFEGKSIGDLGQANTEAFFDSRREKGLIIENKEQIALFSEKDGKYQIVVVGHPDKKTAKGMSIDEFQKKYQSTFDNFETVLNKAKAEADKAKMIANTYEVPKGDYKDKYGISGIYHLSQISRELNYGGPKESKYIKTVNIEFIPEKRHLKIHYADGKTDNASFRKELAELMEMGGTNTPTIFTGSNMNLIEWLKMETMILIEDGVFFLEVSSRVHINTDCNKPEWEAGSKDGNDNFYVLMAKDPKRMEELMSDLEKVKAMTTEAVVKDCVHWNIYREAKNPMPEKSIKDAALQADLTNCVRKGAAGRGWKEEIVYAYPISKEWATLRNKNTGIIVGREIAVVAVMKTDAGRCKWETVYVRQNYNGSAYGNSYFHANSQRIYPIDCEKAMKQK